MEAGTNTIRATVTAVVGEEAMVQVKQGGCGRCHEKGGCGGQQLTQMFCGAPKMYRVDNPLGAVVGDEVEIAIAPGSVRKTANLAYGLPLLACIAAAVAGTALAGDPGGIAGAVGGLSLAWWWVRRRAQSALGKSSARPYILSRS